MSGRQKLKWRLPAEWEPQAATILAWPHNETDWATRLDATEAFYIHLLRTTLAFQEVLLLVPDDATAERVKHRIGRQLYPLTTLACPYDDTWARDYGPLTLVSNNGQALFLDYRFDGWGGKFHAQSDDLVSIAIAEALQVEIEAIPFVMEGGAIDSDGSGSLLTTRQCLQTRHPGMSRAKLEMQLLRTGASRVLWLGRAQLMGDDTDGHVDTLARFVNESTIAYVQSPPDDEHFATFMEMEQQLQQLRRLNGEPYRLVPIPLPDPVYDDGERLGATHLNFMLLNGAALIPVFGGGTDHIAIDAFAEIWPERQIIALDCRPLVWQGGCVHCISMNLPAELSPWLDVFRSR